MTQDEIIRMALEASNGKPRELQGCHLFYPDELERFAALVAAHERVRTKDLTDDEIAQVTGYRKSGSTWPVVEEVARAVIAADREKNHG